jgi:hypothetical protein
VNWDAIGAIGEIVGATAVVITVVYLAHQVRKQTQESRLSATRDISARWDEVMETLISNPDLVEMYGTAVQDYNALPNKERLWASFCFQRLFRVMEQQLLHNRISNIEDDYHQSMSRAFFEFLTFPGVQQWWENVDMFSDEFQKYVRKRLIEAKSQGYSSTFDTRSSDPT